MYHRETYAFAISVELKDHQKDLGFGKIVKIIIIEKNNSDKKIQK
jgi:hypothetical protein